jgi:transposase
MKPPLYVRASTEAEQHAITAARRSSESFTLRRSQILLASARREPVPQIAHALGCNQQTVRNAIHAFNQRGVAALAKGSTRPKTVPHAIFDAARCEQVRALLHQSPRTFGKPTSVWTLSLAADVSHEQGLTPRRVSDEAIRLALARLGVGWRRAKHWITSPDPAYAAKKGDATG